MAKTKRPPQTRKKLGGARVSPDGPRQEKVAAVEDLKTRMGGASAAILTEYRGLTVSELADLRAGLREAGADFKVFKNTLATIAVKDLGLDDLVEILRGPTAFTFVSEDPVVAAKKLAEFAKRAPSLVLKGGVLEGKVLSGEEVKALSALESREVMLATMAGMLAGPVQTVAYLFAAPLQQVGALFARLKETMPAEGVVAAPSVDSSAEAAAEPVAQGSAEAAAEPADGAQAGSEDEQPEEA